MAEEKAVEKTVAKIPEKVAEKQPEKKVVKKPVKELTDKELAKHTIKTFPMVRRIKNKRIRDATIGVFVKAMRLGGWTDMKAVPFTTTIPTKLNYVTHTLVVSTNAVNSAKFLKEKGIRVNMDILIAGALLHDVGKLLEYSPGTGHANKIRHPFSGAALAMEAGLPVDVVHMIATHAAEGNQGIRTTESVIVHHSDFTHFECVKSMMGLK